MAKHRLTAIPGLRNTSPLSALPFTDRLGLLYAQFGTIRTPNAVRTEPMLVGRDYARFIQQYEEGLGNYTEDRHQWLVEQSARTPHEQATQLAASGELPRPVGAKLHGSDG